MADFAMVAGLVALIFAGLVQLGFVLHSRNTLIASAAEGARVGARAGATPEDGVVRTRDLITAQLSDQFAQDISASRDDTSGAQVIVVRVTAPLPLVGPFGPTGGLDVSARAFAEDQ